MTTETTQVTLLPPACRPLPLPKTTSPVWGLRTLVFYTMLEIEQRQKKGLFESSHFECNCYKAEIREQLLADSLEELETYYPQAFLADGSVKNPEAYLDEINQNKEGGKYVIIAIAWMILMHLDTEKNLQNLLKTKPKRVELLVEDLYDFFETTADYENKLFKKLAVSESVPEKMQVIQDSIKTVKPTVTSYILKLTDEQAEYISFQPLPRELPAAIHHYKTLMSSIRRSGMQRELSEGLDINDNQIHMLTKIMNLLNDSRQTLSPVRWWSRCTFRDKPKQLGGTILLSAILIPWIGLTIDLGIHHPKSWQHAFKWEKLAKGGFANPWAKASLSISSVAGFIFLALCFFYLAKKVMRARPEALSPRAASLR